MISPLTQCLIISLFGFFGLLGCYLQDRRLEKEGKDFKDEPQV